MLFALAVPSPFRGLLRRQVRLSKVVAETSSLAVGFVLVVFAAAKAGNPSATLLALSQGFPREAVVPAFAILIMAELVIGAMLLSGWRRETALAISTMLSVCFVLWTSVIAVIAPDLNCGCGGLRWFTFGMDGTAGSLVRATTLFLISVVGLVAAHGVRRDDSHRKEESVCSAGKRC